MSLPPRKGTTVRREMTTSCTQADIPKAKKEKYIHEIPVCLKERWEGRETLAEDTFEKCAEEKIKNQLRT